MSKPTKSDSYMIGYGKPPEHSQFSKGISGNPTGRPRKTLNFDQELIREANSLMFINENGQRKRMSKHRVFIKQLMKQAITGSPQASRIYLGHLRLALENASLAKNNPLDGPGTADIESLTDEELMAIILAGENEKKKE